MLPYGLAGCWLTNQGNQNMSAMIDTSKGFKAFASTNDSEWHGTDFAKILPGDSLDVIQVKSGINFNVNQADVTYVDAMGKTRSFENRVINYRSDTGEALGFVSKNRYNTHQPREITEVFRGAFEDRIETMGALKGGREVFASVRLDGELTGPDGSVMLPYAIVQTSFDGSIATSLFDSFVRPVCANTLGAAQSDEKKTGFRVAHTSEFSAVALRKAFGLMGKEFQQTRDQWNTLGKTKLTRKQAHAFFTTLLGVNLQEIGKVDAKGRLMVSSKLTNQLETLIEAYDSAPGAAPGTAWGALQAVTFYADHKKQVRDTFLDGESSARFSSAQFGDGAALKSEAYSQLLALAA